MSLKDHWNRYGKCVAGMLGGLGTGALGGAAVGSAVPVIGTIGCSILGGISGFLAGAASTCGGK